MQAKDLRRGNSPLPPILAETLEKIWLSFWDGVKTNVETLSVVTTDLKLALAMAHTTVSRGRRWDAERSMLSGEKGKRGLLVDPQQLPCSLPPGLVL